MKRRLLSAFALISIALAPSLIGQDHSGQLVGELLSDAYGEETLLLVMLRTEVKPDQRIRIVARNGAWSEIGEIRHNYGSYLWLKEKLRSEYLAGSRIYTE